MKNMIVFKKDLDWLYDSLPHTELYNKCYHKKVFLKYSSDTTYNKIQFNTFCVNLAKIKKDLNIKFTLYVPQYYDVSYIHINNNLIKYY